MPQGCALGYRVSTLRAGRQETNPARLHPQKSEVFPVTAGIRFLGYRVFPWRRVVTKENVRRFRKRVRRMQEEYAAGKLSAEQIQPRLMSWLGHARQGSAAVWREELFDTFRFQKGEDR